MLNYFFLGTGCMHPRERTGKHG